jgi:hypothetical protein
MAASTDLATPLQFSSCTNHILLSSKVNVEPSMKSITILSDNSDVSSPQDAMPTKCRPQNLPFPNAPNESLACTNRTVLQPGHWSQNSIVDCLKRLYATEGSKNALKMLDYNNVKHLKVDYLPLVFNGDVVFEFPSICSSSRSSQAKLMWVWISDMMDKPGQELVPPILRMIWG